MKGIRHKYEVSRELNQRRKLISIACYKVAICHLGFGERRRAPLQKVRVYVDRDDVTRDLGDWPGKPAIT